MAASSQVSHNKARGRDEYWKGGLALPDAKRTNRTNSGLTMAVDSDLMALLHKIDNIDVNNSNLEQSDVGTNRTIDSLEDEIGLKEQTDHHLESTDEEGTADQMGSNKHGELTAGGNSRGFKYYDDVRAELDFFVDQFTPDELGIIMNHIDGDSNPDITYLDAVHSYVETKETFYASLWEDDIWQLNEHPIIQNYFASPREHEESGINGAEFQDMWN